MNTGKLLPLVVLAVVMVFGYTGNLGPNIQTTGAPANPLVQSIHPK